MPPLLLRIYNALRGFFKSWPGFLVLLFALYFGVRHVQSNAGKHAFLATGLPQHSLQQAQQLAQAQNKTIVVEFSAYWCSSCKQLDKELFSQPQVVQWLTHQHVYARIDEASPEGEVLMRQYGVRGFPTLLLLDAQGRVLKTLPLTLDAEEFGRSLRF